MNHGAICGPACAVREVMSPPLATLCPPLPGPIFSLAAALGCFVPRYPVRYYPEPGRYGPVTAADVLSPSRLAYRPGPDVGEIRLSLSREPIGAWRAGAPNGGRPLDRARLIAPASAEALFFVSVPPAAAAWRFHCDGP
jgi:hypothetical protein